MVDACWNRSTALAKEAYGVNCILPDIKLEGHLEATFPYILSHLVSISSELLPPAWNIDWTCETGSKEQLTSPKSQALSWKRNADLEVS